MPIRIARPKNLLDVDTAEPFPAPGNPTELLSITQAAAFAGVAPITVRRWVKQRLLPAYRAGHQIRIDKAELIKFMSQ
ncbi:MULTISPECIES: helix-turn-helix domain-containing protein [Mesorhizobium]|nr:MULTISPECIES: helix-turn-helix domain-containing protein [Mesorhizobium]